MPTNHEAVAALPITNKASQTLIRNMLVQRLAYVVTSAAEAADLVATDPTTGVTILTLILFGRFYVYDAADTITAHDGTTCLVSSEGNRYKLSEGAELVRFSVLDRINTPPVGPSLGDAYLITTAPTGDWAGHADDIGIYTARGWEFLDPAIGRFIYVEDEDAYYHKKSNGSIVVGFGTQALGSATVVPSNLVGGGARVRWIVQNQVTNAPPAAIDGTAYIIGPAPTGDWAGHSGTIAHRENGVWVIYAPDEGWKVYDKSQDADYLYDGAAWVTATGVFKVTRRFYNANDTWVKANAPRLFACFLAVQGAGGGGSGLSTGGTGGTTSIGTHVSATGGAGGNSAVPVGGAGGVGSSGDMNVTGQAGSKATMVASAMVEQTGGVAGGQFGGQYGNGGNCVVSGAASGASGGAGGFAQRWRTAAQMGTTETVTIGAAGTAGTSGIAGKAGAAFIDEYTLV